MKIGKSIFKLVSIVTIFSVLTRFLGFLFRIFLSRKLGAEGLGIYQIAASIVGIFLTLVASGLPLTTAKLVAKYENCAKLKQKNIATTSSFVVSVVVSIISCLILILGKSALNIFVKDNTIIELIFLMCPAIIFSAVYAVFRGALWGQNSYFWVGFTEFLEQAIRIVLTILIIGKISNVIVCTKLVAFGFSLTCLISAILVIIVYLFKGGRFCFKKSEYKNILKSATPITGVRLASSCVQPITALLIPFLLTIIGYTNAEAVSIYGVIMGMTFPLLFAPLSVVGSLSMVLIPKISVLNENKEYSKIHNNINNSINFSLFLSCLIIPLYLSCGDLIGLVLFNNLNAGIYLQLSAVCVLAIVLNNITNSILNALNLEVKSFINYICGTIVMFISLIVLTFIIKEKAIIVSMFLSSFTTTLLNLKMIKNNLPNIKLNFVNTLLKYCLIMLPCSVLGHLISNNLHHFIPPLFAGIVGGGFAIVSTFILIKTFNVYNFKFKKNQA